MTLYLRLKSKTILQQQWNQISLNINKIPTVDCKIVSELNINFSSAGIGKFKTLLNFKRYIYSEL